MSVIWKCPCCYRRHFGACPLAKFTLDALKMLTVLAINYKAAEQKTPGDAHG